MGRWMSFCCSLALVMSIMASSEFSYADGGSLLPGGVYPEAQCRSPLRPLGGDGPREWTYYRQDMLRYRACIENYAQIAREDIKRIQAQLDKAVREYNREASFP